MPVQGGVALIAREIGREARRRVAWVAARSWREPTAAALALASDECVDGDLAGGAALANACGALAGRVEHSDRPSADCWPTSIILTPEAAQPMPYTTLRLTADGGT